MDEATTRVGKLDALFLHGDAMPYYSPDFCEQCCIFKIFPQKLLFNVFMPNLTMVLGPATWDHKMFFELSKHKYNIYT